MAMKSAAKSHLTTGKAPVAIYFKVTSHQPSESQLQFGIIHFWEATNFLILIHDLLLFCLS